MSKTKSKNELFLSELPFPQKIKKPFQVIVGFRLKPDGLKTRKSRPPMDQWARLDDDFDDFRVLAWTWVHQEYFGGRHMGKLSKNHFKVLKSVKSILKKEGPILVEFETGTEVASKKNQDFYERLIELGFYLEGETLVLVPGVISRRRCLWDFRQELSE
jgi:hypothetical protein